VLEGDQHDWLSDESETRLMCDDSPSIGASGTTGLARRSGSVLFGFGYEHGDRASCWYMMQSDFESLRTYIILQHGLESKRNAIVPISLTSTSIPITCAVTDDVCLVGV
jgi:hypothetical protein